MAIHIEESVSMQAGAHRKKIDAAGIHMTMDAMQRYQYTYPVKSIVRELLSNAIDSIREKHRARAILTGQAKVEDYFADLEGEIYKDSRWKPEYYDLAWLDFDRNQAILQYRMSGMDRDTVVFEDRGVGLGGRRLEGYFDLTFSTKRLEKAALGKWGVGAKSPLSAGEKFYTMETWYNGKYFKFQIYDHAYFSLIPKFNLGTGQENAFVIFETDEDKTPVYWEPTQEKNGVRITLQVKKHHKQQYIDAVKSQMLYFDNIDFAIVHSDGRREPVPYRANILYEDEMIVMSDNNYYSKPHLLLNGVNYGYIDWSELELQDMQGNIGIKVAPEDVEVNMSRESVLWTEKTKEKVLRRFEQVVEIAQKHIQEELKETDFVKWLKTCHSVSARYAERSGIVGRLAKIVDLSQMDLVFGPVPKITYKQYRSLDILYRRRVQMDTTQKAGVFKRKIDRDTHVFADMVANRKIVLLGQDEKVSNRTDKYLLTLYPEGFIQVHEPYDTLEQMEATGLGEAIIKHYGESRPSERRMLWDVLCASTEVLQYSAVEVPESFTGSDEEEEVQEEEKSEDDVQKEEVARITAEERRKLEGKTIVHSLRATSGWSKVDDLPAAYEWAKMEVPIKDINDWDAEEIYYGSDADQPLFHFVAMLTRDPYPENKLGNPCRGHAATHEDWKTKKWWRLNNVNQSGPYGTSSWEAYRMQHFFDTKIMLVKAAQANHKYYRDFQKIQEFFIQINNNTITMSNKLIQWNTARIVKEKLAPGAFLYNFEKFNPAYASMYEALTNYVDNHYREVECHKDNVYGLSDQTYGDLISHLDNVRTFQEFVSRGRSAEEVAKLANSLFGNRELTNGMAVDPAVMQMLEQVLEFATAVGPMLNYLPYLTGYYEASMQAPPYKPGQTRYRKPVPEDLELEVRMYLEYKGVLDYSAALEEDDPSPAEQLVQVLEGERMLLPADDV